MAAMQVTTSTPDLCDTDRQQLERAYKELQEAQAVETQAGNQRFNGKTSERGRWPWTVIQGARVADVFDGTLGDRKFFVPRQRSGYNQDLYDALAAAHNVTIAKKEQVLELQAKGESLCAALPSR